MLHRFITTSNNNIGNIEEKCLQLLTPFFGTCQSREQTADEGWADARMDEKLMQIELIGQKKASRPVELRRGRQQVILDLVCLGRVCSLVSQVVILPYWQRGLGLGYK